MVSPRGDLPIHRNARQTYRGATCVARPKAGQIEPNWQHDLRNLQHSLKRNGTVINPSFEVWGLPINVVETNQLERAWRKACDIGGVPGASSTIKA